MKSRRTCLPIKTEAAHPARPRPCYKTTPTRQCLIAIVFKVVKPYSASNPFAAITRLARTAERQFHPTARAVVVIDEDLAGAPGGQAQLGRRRASRRRRPGRKACRWPARPLPLRCRKPWRPAPGQTLPPAPGGSAAASSEQHRHLVVAGRGRAVLSLPRAATFRPSASASATKPRTRSLAGASWAHVQVLRRRAGHGGGEGLGQALEHGFVHAALDQHAGRSGRRSG